MTCAKKRVGARIVAPDGREAWGWNTCASPQPHCPRKAGEGYEKCTSVCQQQGHAEEQALEQAALLGFPLSECEAWVYGIDAICGGCIKALASVDIRRVNVVP